MNRKTLERIVCKALPLIFPITIGIGAFNQVLAEKINYAFDNDTNMSWIWKVTRGNPEMYRVWRSKDGGKWVVVGTTEVTK